MKKYKILYATKEDAFYKSKNKHYLRIKGKVISEDVFKKRFRKSIGSNNYWGGYYGCIYFSLKIIEVSK